MKLQALFGGTALALLAAIVPAQAQVGIPEDKAVDELVITAMRFDAPRATVPSTIQIIGAGDLRIQQSLGMSAVEAVAALAPSFSPTRQKLSGAGETLRGRSPLYLVDGVPQSTPLRDDSRDGFTIDPFFIDRVEVVFGSNAIQGVGATGGVINYVTAPTPKSGQGWTGKVLAQTSFDEGNLDDSFSYKAAGLVGRDFGAWDFVAGASYEERGGYFDADGRRIGIDATQGELQNSDSWSLFGKAGVDLGGERRLEAMVNHFALEGGAGYVLVNGARATGRPASAVKGVQPGKAPANEVTSAAITYKDGALFGGALTAQAFAHDYHGVFGGSITGTFQDVRIAPINTLFDQSANNSQKQGFKLDYERGFAALPGFKVLVGLDGLKDKTYQELLLTNRIWVPKTTYKSLSPFLQVHQALWDDRIHLSAGVRQENATLEVGDFTTLASSGATRVSGGEPSFTEVLSNVGATFRVMDGVTTYASYAQGFTMPDVGRVLRAINTPGRDIDTYLDVNPVVSDNIELGVEFTRGPVNGSLAWFTSSSDKGALLVLNAGGTFDVQRQRTEIEGIEATVKWAANTWLTLGAAYSHLDGRTDTNGDGAVDADLDGANISPDRLTLTADATYGAFDFRLQGQVFEARSFQGQPVANNFEGYELLDAVAAWNGPFGVVSLGVRNLLDAQYITYNSDTTNPTDNSRYFAGQGRAVTLGIVKSF
ncbi:TonB-dependent receptor [Phenylobacterium sp.]|uniref:TonB-dependent receptor n=1 Tax=Phenylobacterium sp. TaxID=1871053 RepID=UPI002726F1DC|nr:TonB-dependent receptor [Phenylobacterium sp.]MDO8802048.1 TonB-dependent receptor [Phenylobacterium sp.]